jgi:predicted tellurium resistance membrane protein TerC
MDPTTALSLAAAFASLLALEVVLGIDNIVVIAIVTARLPQEKQSFARRLGLGLAMFMRIAMLFGIAWLTKLDGALFEVFGREISTKDIILMVGGAFLIAKATKELHEKIEGKILETKNPVAASMTNAIVQILAFDLVFSLDSILTAVGLTDVIWIMVTAIVIAVLIMMIFADWISAFLEKHPTTKVLALAFMLLVGILLVADGLGEHIPRGYIYFALAFSLGIEVINIRVRAREVRRMERKQGAEPS